MAYYGGGGGGAQHAYSGSNGNDGGNNGFYSAPQPQSQQQHDPAPVQQYHRPQRQQTAQSMYHAASEDIYDSYSNAYHGNPSEPDHVGGGFEPSASRTHLAAHAQPMASDYPPVPSPYAPQGTAAAWSPAHSQLTQQKSYNEGSYFPMPTPNVAAGPYSPAGNYGNVREKMMKRRSVRQVELQQGNLVLDCPVPTSILSYAKQYPGAVQDEMTKMRYTACTCDPDDFIRERYTLRPYLYGRKTEMAIVATMYNEDEVLFCRTMTSIVMNIQNLQSRTKSKVWGPDSWKKIVVVIVSDGRAKVNKRTLNVLGLMGVYQDGIAKDTVAGKDVTAHVYEYTTQVVVDEAGNVAGGISPIQVCFVLKEQNKKKLNSHRWFFNAVCAQLKPEVCILIDVGTKPSGTSLHALHKAFDSKNVGGCCGEITVDTGRGCGNLLNPLVAAQNFEYKMSNILDKPTESVFGYISVLPGAFSAYRYKALLNSSNGKGPLASYFLGEKMHEPGAHAGVFESNMYLAEDRILCFEIVTKKREAWVLRYVKSAKASTDVPNRTDDLIGQRRRWLNGSFFAALHATIMFGRIWTSGHNPLRKLWLTIEFIYNAINLLFTWTALANFYLSIFFVFQAATSLAAHDPFFGQGKAVLQIVQNVYIGLLFIVLICSLGNRPAGSKFAYNFVVVAFALIFGMAIYCTGWLIYWAVPHTSAGWSNFGALIKQSAFRDILISLAATYGLYFIASFIHFEPWHMFTCFIQYFLLLPFSVNVLAIYSMSNLHDLSWGTKGLSGPEKNLGKASVGKDGNVEVDVPTAPEDINQLWIAMRKDLSVKPLEKHEKRDAETKTKDSYATYRTNVLLFYILTNVFIALFFTSTYFEQLVKQEIGVTTLKTPPYNAFIFWSVAGLSAFRTFGTVMYLLLRLVGH